MKENEILEEIHRFRAEHARECGYDVHKIFQQVRKGTERLKADGWRIVSPAKLKSVETSYALRDEAPLQKNSVTQREKMSEFYVRFRGNKEQCVKAYAEAELMGQVSRKKNAHDGSPEKYASRLFEDGVKKGWLV